MKLKILAGIVDTKQLTLYKADGEVILIKQGDPRLRPILDEITPQIIARGYAEIELESVAVPTGYQEFEKQSGVVRFFKVARDKLANLFRTEPVEAAVVGTVPTHPSEQQLTTVSNVFDEIMANAQPVSDPAFTTDGVKPQGAIEVNGITDRQRDDTPTTHTIVAKVGNTLIPDMERIETHFTRAAKLGSTKGVEAFLKRLASVIQERSHSVEDLLKFMERGDMPIADDGSIIIYKVLNRQGDHYVDCHTKTVKQRIGSYVCMDINLVDRNRNEECSNGLHVARRGYINGFSGDVCTVCKLAPEDVVTVPVYDANKMRVMGYHILHELTSQQFQTLKQNKPITNTDEGKTLIGNILAGNHVARLEEVRIVNQSRREDSVVVSPITTLVVKKVKPKAEIKAEALANPAEEKASKPVNPKDVVKAVAKLSRKEEAQKLYQAFLKKPTKKNLEKLVAFKKEVKLGWDKLGIDASKLKLN